MTDALFPTLVRNTETGHFGLELTQQQRTSMARAADSVIDELLSGLDKVDMYSDGPEDRVIADMLAPPSNEPCDLGIILARLKNAMSLGRQDQNPRNFAYVPGGGVYSAVIGDTIAKAANRYTTLASINQTLVAMEHGIVRWLCDEFALGGTASGIATTGASIATLTALVAARCNRLGEDFTNGAVYASERTHHCLAKAMRIAGFRASQLRLVPTDNRLRLDLTSLETAIAEDKAAGLKPFMLVGNAGTVDSGSIDPLPAIGHIARRENLWFHVDAAYGGFFHLTEIGRERLAGISTADSIALDPHKGLFLPFGTGLLLVRDEKPLRFAFSYSGDYLNDIGRSEFGLPDYAMLGPELTRDFRGLRLWLPLHLHGRVAFSAALAEKLELAQRVWQRLADDLSFELPFPPELSTVVFRLRDSDDDQNRALLRKCNETKRISLSSTTIGGALALRMCILNYRSHQAHVDEAIEIIRGAARSLKPTN